MATSILPTKFDGDDFVAWLRKFDACTLANAEKNSPIIFPNDSQKNNAVIVQSQLLGGNKITLSEGMSIPARSEIIIAGSIKAKNLSHVGMISASKSESVRHQKVYMLQI